MERIGHSFGLNMLLIGATEFLAYLSASYTTKFIKRKIGIILSIMATSGFGLLFLIEFVKNEDRVQSVLAVLARVGSVYAYCFLLLLQS